MKFLSLIVIASIALCVIGGIIAVTFQAITGVELSSTLIDRWFTVFGVELGAAALIQITKIVTDELKRRNRVNHMKENGIEPKRSDFNNGENNYYDNFMDSSYDEPMG
ncbi:MAG: hypothetical protein E7080_10650 [Bacteroidales bacterium]|nr:hypothetical protein [Bacteroidales bacterium]